MNKKVLLVAVVAVIAAFVAASVLETPAAKDDVAFHITLADPELYRDGTFSESFGIEEGDYTFRFVPNGDSPQILGITVGGDGFYFEEEFELVGTPHRTDISEYYTWEYDGVQSFSVPESQEVTIVIDPNGNTLGAVSVDILKERGVTP